MNNFLQQTGIPREPSQQPLPLTYNTELEALVEVAKRHPTTQALLGTSNTDLQEALLTLLAILCSHPECKDHFADANAMPALVRLIGSKKSNVVCTACIRNIEYFSSS